MIILNSFLNNYFNKNKINNNHKISFQANINKISKEIMLKKSDYEKISELAILHQNISDACALLRKKLKTAIKQSYPGLVSSKKRKGFIFDSLSKDKSILIQMVKYNMAKEKDELITLNILDKALEPLFSFRFDKAGKVLITSDENRLKNISKNPFENILKTLFKKYFEPLVQETKILQVFCENFKVIKKTHPEAKTKNKLIEVTKNFSSLASSVGIKQEIEETVRNFKSLHELLNQNIKKAYNLKLSYLGADESMKNFQSFTFKNVGKNGETYSFCLNKSKDKSRAFRVFVIDQNSKIKQAFVFFNDGRIAKLRNTAKTPYDLRPSYIEFISDREIENFQIKEILKILNEKFADFEKYINTKRENKIERKILTEQEKRERAKIRAKIKAEKIAEAKAKIKEQRQQERLLNKKRREQELSMLKEKHKAEKTERLKEPKKAKEKAIKAEEKLKIKEKDIQAIKIKAQNEFKNIPLYKLSEKFKKLFDTPIEKRSSHLIYQKLANGEYFNAKFSLKSSDGAMITVAKIKSQKYMDFCYYSITAEKNGEKLVLNFDPFSNKIIKSTKDGKPFIDDKNNLHFISKEKFLAKTPYSENIGLYIKEIFESKPL